GEPSIFWVLQKFGVEKGIVEASAGGIGGTATEINSVEACPICSGKAHGTGLAACVEFASGEGKSPQSLACGSDGVDLAMSRGIIRCGDGVCTFADDLAGTHDDCSKWAAFAGDDIPCCERDGPSEEFW